MNIIDKNYKKKKKNDIIWVLIKETNVKKGRWVNEKYTKFFSK